MTISLTHTVLKDILTQFTIKSKFGLGFLFIIVTHIAQAQVLNLEYPKIKTEAGVDIYFSDTITDAYRSMERDTAADISKWYRDQNGLAVSVLKNINGRQSLLDTYIAYDDRSADIISLLRITSNGNHFYLKQLAGEDRAKLYYRKKYESSEILLYDPKDYQSKGDSNYSINYLNPSWDGTMVVLALSTAGKEISDLITVDVKTKKPQGIVLHNAWPSSFLGVSWLPDNSGFSYLYFPQGTAPSGQEEKTYSVLHKITDDEGKLVPIFGSGVSKNLDIPSSGVYPIAKIKDADDNYVIGYIATVENYWDAYYCKMEDFKLGKFNWQPLYKKTDKVYAGSEIFDADTVYFRSAAQSSNYQVCKVNMSTLDIQNPKVVVPAFEEETITDFNLVQNKLYVTTSKNGVEAKLYMAEKKEIKQMELPHPSGSIDMMVSSGANAELWIKTAGWVNDYQRYRYNPSTNTFLSENLSNLPSFPEFKNIVAEEVEISSHDGVSIPISIIHRGDLKKNSKNPILFYSYGAYGESIEPFYSPVFLEWVRRGGVLCVPHVRGGGEKGDQWHQAGLMATKPNTWGDLIAAIKYMHRQKYSQPDKTVIYSSSAGGIMVGRAMIELPDLMKAMIAEVPQMNPARTAFKNDGGGSNELEYGSLKDSIQAAALLNMDPYLNLKERVAYPAMLLTAGMNDPRIPVWIPGKFIAKAQEFTSSSNPILFRVDPDAGHGIDEDYLKYYQDYADVFGFAFWQTGNPDFRLNDSLVKVLSTQEGNKK